MKLMGMGLCEASIDSALGTVASLHRVKRFDSAKWGSLQQRRAFDIHCGYEKYVKIPYSCFD